MHQTKKIFIRGVITSLAGGICWGFSGACGEYLLQHTSVSLMYLSWFRFVCAAPCFALLIAAKDRKRFVRMITDLRSVKKLIIYTVFGLVACQLVYMASIQVTNAGTATVLQCLEIVMILAWTSFVYHKAPSKRDVAGFILAFLSVFIIATHGDPTQLVLPIAGIILGLLNAFFCFNSHHLSQRALSALGQHLYSWYRLYYGCDSANYYCATLESIR